MYDECVKVENLGPENRVRNKIYLIVRYEWDSNRFLWWRDRKSSVYAARRIWNLCFVYIVYQSEKIYMWCFMTGIITFIHVTLVPIATIISWDFLLVCDLGGLKLKKLLA